MILEQLLRNVPIGLAPTSKFSLSKFQLGLSHAKIASICGDFGYLPGNALADMVDDYPSTTS